MTAIATRTATLIKKLDGFSGDARLYRVSPAMSSEAWGDDPAEQYEYVVVSAVVARFSGPETYIFGADESGSVASWSELPGSFRGGLCHSTALENAGYDIQ